ncbi:MAG: DUF5071 domain-containing protein [Bacillales bacterium]|nr:DUF5071 domain-containing protein [Bacillales bacterium]
MILGIDDIFYMLSSEREADVQAEGIKEAKKIKNLSVLIQPMETKMIWENCAKVLVSKTDQELEFYLSRLFMWLQDMNWPGADLIFQRLKDMPWEFVRLPYEISCKIAHRTNDVVWLAVLDDFLNSY